MFKQWNHYQLLIMCVILIFVTTACLRDYDEGVGVQPISQLIPTEISDATEELQPTEDIAEETQEPDVTEEVVLEEPTITATSTVTPSLTATPSLTVTPSITPTPTITIPAASATMTIDPLFLRLTPSATPLPSDEGIVNIGNTSPGGTAIAQAFTPTQDSQPDDFALTATALIGQLTLDAQIVLTTQAAEAGLFPTNTPEPTIDPAFVLTPTAITGGGSNVVPGADCVHQIRAGETLFKLSLAYGISVSEMQTASNIGNANLILVGQRVTIPRCGTTGFTPPPTSVPVPTATLIAVAQTNTQVQAQTVPGAGSSTVTTDSLAVQAQQDILNNAQADIQANAVAQGVAPATGSRQYTVQQYDTLFQIATSFGTTVDAIATLNGITNINSITMGDVLQIP